MRVQTSKLDTIANQHIRECSGQGVSITDESRVPNSLLAIPITHVSQLSTPPPVRR